MSAETELDPGRALRRSMGCFATGVTIVTAPNTDGPPVGMTVSSFNSVSIEPPLVLFSIARTARSLADLERAETYAVNVLSSAHVDLSNRFARAGEDKWDGVEFVLGEGGVPIFDDAVGSFDCVPYATYDGGDHLIFVGEVVRHRSADHLEPLLFYRGGYHLATPHTS